MSWAPCYCCGRTPPTPDARITLGPIHFACWDEHHSDPTGPWPDGHRCTEEVRESRAQLKKRLREHVGCPGLRACLTHPVLHVWKRRDRAAAGRPWRVSGPNPAGTTSCVGEFETFEEALSVALGELWLHSPEV